MNGSSCIDDLQEQIVNLNLSGDDSGSDAECPICCKTYKSDDENSLWVSCDGCDRWFDFKCTGLVDGNKMPKEFLCSVDCK